jgi:YD repeat-containing protein
VGRIPVQFAYHPGDLLSVTDPLGRTTKYAYDPFNEVTSVTDPLNGTASFSYDLTSHQLASITDRLNHSSSISYDGSENLTLYMC